MPVILVIDDSHTIRKSAEIWLKPAGFDVVVAEDGFSALPLIVEHHPSVILVDVMMPRLDGYQICALVKDNPQFASISVIMLSSKDSIFDRAKGRIVGADEYLSKPFSKDSLLAIVSKHMELQHQMLVT